MKTTPLDPKDPQVFAVEIKEGKACFSRRDFLLAAGVATAATLASCTPEPNLTPTDPPTPTAAPTPIVTATPAPTLSPDLLEKCGARAHKGEVDHLVISQDSSILVSSDHVGTDVTIKVWLLPYGALLHTFEMGGTMLLKKIVISPDNRYLAAGNDSFINVWSLPDGTLRNTFDASTPMAISPDGSTLAEGVGEKIDLWSLSDGKLLKRLEGHRVIAFDLLFSPDGSSLIVIDRDEIGVLSYPDGALMQTLVGGEKNWRANINLSGSRLVVDTGDGVQIWSLPEGELLQAIEVDTASGSIPAISPDGSLLVVGSGLNNRKIEIWSLPEGKRLRSLEHPSRRSSEGHSSLAASPDGALLVSGASDGTIKLWSLPDGAPIACPMDLEINNENVKGVSYELTNDAGGVRTITLPCGSPIPEGAVCTCNCVAGGMCSCVGHSCSCDGHTTGSHYWYPN